MPNEIKSTQQLNLFELQPFPAPVLCFGGKRVAKGEGWEASLHEACTAQRRSDEEFAARSREPAKLSRHQLLQKQLFQGHLDIGKRRWTKVRSCRGPTLCRKQAVWLTMAEALAFLDTPDARELKKIPDVHWRSTLGY